MQRSPECRITYKRSGNLATVTKLDQEKADEFMFRADMRRDMVIVDSDKPVQKEAVNVSSDTLAFRAIEPIHRLTQIRLKPKPFHTLICEDEKFRAEIHERQIDDAIRSRHFIDRSDYNTQFLQKLNQATKDALLESLFYEKLGWNDQKTNYVFHLGYFCMAPLFIFILKVENMIPGPLQGYEPWLMIPGFFAANVLGNSIVNYINWQVHAILTIAGVNKPFASTGFSRHDGKELLLPLVPIEKYVAGRRFLDRNGSDLIVPTGSA